MIARPARAKINLGLHILRKRPDGYHDIESVMLPVAWADTVTVEPEHTLSFTCDDPDLANDDNLCLRAAAALREKTGVARGARIHLAKRLPYGAGLGGGSSDAAATIRLLVELWGSDLTANELFDLAASIGSDVPFFLQDEAALATGRGETLSPLEDNHGGPYTFPYDLVIAVPTTRISTPEAYRQVQPDDRNRPDLRGLVRSNDLERWRRFLVNDFEASVLPAFAEVVALKTSLYESGADYASLSGSGSAVFGVFENSAAALGATEALRANGHTVWHGVSAV
ncbi:MAG: 4-(cytidine 5'-diphospho)-2-C-methyl-D-erythritol kinase [Bacteroidota bacterium]